MNKISLYIATSFFIIFTANINAGDIGKGKEKSITCIACHGPNGDGNGPAAIPVLSGQHAEYIYSQLKNFQSSMRSNDPNKMMRNIVHRMTDEEIKSVAQYIQGLH